MVVICRYSDRIVAALTFAAALALFVPNAGDVYAGDEKLVDAPVVWHTDDRRNIPEPRDNDPNVAWAGVEDSIELPFRRFLNPVRVTRKIGTAFGGDHVRPAANINALDETPNSTWFTNRIGMFSLSLEEVARRPGLGTGPDRSAKWTVISGKSEGVTKGFHVRDANGDVFIIKFDPPNYLGATVGAGVIANRILYAAGYNVPDDAAIVFTRDDLVLGEDATIRDGKNKRPMTQTDLDETLDGVDRLPDGRWLAISSKFLSGKPVGRFNYRGRRKDDPNDRINHENRRELRGLRVIAAWLNHYDTKQDNSLDMYVTDNGSSFIRHYLIDLASTLGAGGQGPSRRSGYEFTVDAKAVFSRLFTVGLIEDRWRKRRRPEELPEVGYFVSDVFEPHKFRPHNPNSAFANLTDRDAYWAAKIVVAFSDDHIHAIVAEARYPHAEASDYVSRILIERRDKIARHYFSKVTPLDFFTANDSKVRFVDLAQKYGTFPGTAPRYRLRCAAVNEDREAHSLTEWSDLSGTSIDLSSNPVAAAMSSAPEGRYPFLAMELQVDRGDGWSPSVTAYRARRSGRILAIDR